MNSIARYLDGFDIAQTVEMLRSEHLGSFLLLEGLSDIKRFGRFVDDIECQTVNCFGKKNATDAIMVLESRAFQGALAVVDSDFDRLVGRSVSARNIIVSEFHDLDLDWISDASLKAYLNEVSDVAKVSAAGGTQGVISLALEMLKPISVCRMLQAQGVIKHSMKELDIQACLSGITCDIEAFIDQFTDGGRRNRAYRDSLVGRVKTKANETYDLRQITNGHDIHCALGHLLRGEIGNRRDVHTWGDEIAKDLRLSFDDSDFRNTRVFGEICSWESNNEPYLILDSRLRPH